MNVLYHLFPGLYNTFIMCGASIADAIVAAPLGGGVRRPFVKIYWRVPRKRSGFYRHCGQEQWSWRWAGKMKRWLKATRFVFLGGWRGERWRVRLQYSSWIFLVARSSVLFLMHLNHTKAPPPAGCLVTALGAMNGTATLIIDIMEIN